MAEVQWIKLKVGMFDGNSFKKIKRAKIGGVPFRDKLTAVWFELLDLAGKSNANGYLIDNNEIPYHSFEDIATMLDREEKEIELCMQFFINERMIEIIDDIYCLTNFVRFQNKEGLDKIREQTRKRVAKCRERKLLAQGSVTSSVTGSVTVTDGNALEEEIDEDKEKEKEYHSFTQAGESDLSNPESRRTYLGGIGKNVVFLSDEQMSDLLDKLSVNEFDYYVGVIAEEELKGHRYKKKTHYQAILEMANKDRKII